MIRNFSTKRAPKAIGPYSQAVLMGNIIITSGQIPIVPSTGEIVEGGIIEQTKQVLENIKNLLEDSGSMMSYVLKSTIFIKDMNDFQTINEIYSSYFTEPYPARSCVEVSRLPKDVLIEIEVIAEIPAGN